MSSVRIVLSKDGYLEDVVDANGNPIDYRVDECEQHQDDPVAHLWYCEQEVQTESLIQCARCHKTPSDGVELMKCPACSSEKPLESAILYCSEKCQREDW